MNFYHSYILPVIISHICGVSQVMDLRKKVIPIARGDVLEIGMGSGINLPLYNTELVRRVWGIDPSAKMRELAQKNIKNVPFTVEWLDYNEDSIALPDESIDTIVLTFTLCTIPDWETALNEMRRVLKPKGTLIFCEHGTSPDKNIRRLQDRINPFWRPFAGGCNLNRPIDQIIQRAGFTISSINTHYMPRTPKIAGYTYYGQAEKIL